MPMIGGLGTPQALEHGERASRRGRQAGYSRFCGINNTHHLITVIHYMAAQHNLRRNVTVIGVGLFVGSAASYCRKPRPRHSALLPDRDQEHRARDPVVIRFPLQRR